MDPLPVLEDDGLFTPVVGEWAEHKYRLISSYAQMFSASMKGKWDTRAYIDLFAGAGRGQVQGTNRIVPTSALLALGVRDPFDRYVFCDIDPERTGALKARARREHPGRDVRDLTGDSNQLMDEVLQQIPRGRRGASVLSFCVADPSKMGTLKFTTVERLSSIFVDFLVLIPSYMDANRNEGAYVSPDNTTVAEFVGNPAWRAAWAQARGEFGTFIVDQFGRSMKRLGFIYEGPGEEVLVCLPRRNVKLYHLAFYSKNALGIHFWRQARKYSDDQMGLFG